MLINQNSSAGNWETNPFNTAQSSQFIDILFQLNTQSFDKALPEIATRLNPMFNGSGAVLAIIGDSPNKPRYSVSGLDLGDENTATQFAEKLLFEGQAEARTGLDTIAAFMRNEQKQFGGLAIYRAAPFAEKEKQALDYLAEQLGPALAQHLKLEELEQAIQVRDDFLSVATHDLRNPLSSLRGFAQLTSRLIEKTGPDQLLPRERVQTNMQRIVRQTDNVNDLIEKILDFSRILTNRFELNTLPVELAALVQEVVTKFQIWLSDQERGSDPAHMHNVQLDLDAYHLKGDFDQARLTQIINSLLHNAFKFSPYGGTILVRLARQDTTACLTVKDPGLGIVAEKKPYIFESWKRPRGPQETGLGVSLFIGKEIAKRHGGQLEYETFAERGTTFKLALPLQ